ncbi:MAG: hypothetical protein ACNA8S_09900 [Deferrisomatales bacterium]
METLDADPFSDRSNLCRAWQWLRSHARRAGLVALNILLNNDLVFHAVGRLNRRLGLLATVFVAYPASDSFSDAYGYRWTRARIRWRPWVCGVFRQGRRWGLVTAVASTESDFLNPANHGALRSLVARTERLRRLLGAERSTYAGILPGVLYSRRLVRQTPEADVTVDVLVRAEAEVRRRLGWADHVPVVVLGGRGFIGRRLVRRLAEQGRVVHPVDLNGGGHHGWPGHLAGTRAVLVNAARRGALGGYLPHFWPELALLNEVYPEPDAAELDALRRIGSPAFHVAGVAAQCLPPFPGAYRGAVPCCAALPGPALAPLVCRLA